MYKKMTIAFMAIFACAQIQAQTETQRDSLKKIGLNEVVVSGNKFAEKKKNIVQKIEIIQSKELAQMNAQSVGDALINTGQVFVQKSQQGSGSPVLRGFEASRIQLNIDGIRLNNAIYRSGHLQNSMTVDNNALDRIEVLFGPASTVHGADALGGVIMMKTKDPKFSKSKKIELTGANAFVRYSSVNQEKTVNAGINWGGRKLAFYTNITHSQFEDLVQGKNGVDSIMRLWKKNFIVERVNGVDSMVANPNPYKQVASGFNQIDILQKIKYKPRENISLGLNLQLSNSSNLPRYDRLSETSGGIARNAEWYYGPQFRTLGAFNLDIVRMKGFFNDLTFTVSNQLIQESRHNRGFRKPTLASRTEDLIVNGGNFALRHKDDVHELTVGADAQFNHLTSTAFATNVATGVRSKIDTRYPDGNNNMYLIGFYAQHLMKLYDGKLVLNDGLRLSYNNLQSTLSDTSIQFKLPILDLKQTSQAITGNLGLAYMPNDNLRMTANYSTGFRAPNFDDMAKVFESNANQLIVPNVNLKPEYTQNIEIGLRHNNGKFEWGTYGFYTHFSNAIVTDKFTYQGQDSILYDGKLTRVFASQNKAKAFIYGGGLDFVYRPESFLTLYGAANYTFGRFNSDTALIPLDHVPPVNGRLGVKYQKSNWYAEVYSLFNGAKKLIDYNPNGEDNLQYATPQGTPSWYTVNLRAGYTVTKYVMLQFGVENILDKNYRYFASGTSAPGRNVVVAVRMNY